MANMRICLLSGLVFLTCAFALRNLFYMMVIVKDNRRVLITNEFTKTVLKSPFQYNGVITMADDIPTLYLITPTYSRPSQYPDLLKNCQTFRQVHHLHWIIIEDANEKSTLVAKILKKCAIPFTHINIKTPDNIGPNRGIFQRNLGMNWIRENIDPKSKGIFYFADDDNTYDTELFEYIRNTRQISAWPVGLVGGLLYEGPVKNGSSVVWITIYDPERVLPLDMAGFSLNIELLFRYPEHGFSLESRGGHLESDILKGFGASKKDVQFPCGNVNRALVWHVKAKLH